MRFVDLIARKRDGLSLTAAELQSIVAGVVDGTLPDYQVAAFLMAVYFRGMSPAELATWADSMLRSGIVLDLSDIPGIKVDKHSTGGVGDKISLILAPLVAAAGVPVPMISGRGLGHTGGTLDKLEAIPGFNTQLDIETFRRLVRELRCGLIGQTAEIAPADRKLYALRDVTATVECIPLIASSIMSKKLAEGIDALVLDVKFGSGAFMAQLPRARELAQTMVAIGEAAGRKTVALLTDMNQPLGAMIGNSLEVIESCDVLRGGGPADIRELTLALSAEMLVLGGVSATIADARATLVKLLDNGAAFAQFEKIVAAQGGDARALSDYSRLPVATQVVDVVAESDGVVHGFECAEVGRAAMLLGAGRATRDDIVDPGVGLQMHVRIGSHVRRGDLLARAWVSDRSKTDEAFATLRDAIVLGDGPAVAGPLVLERIDASSLAP
jgi:pyrimidine-nucleoside phosphorylase